MNSEGYKPSDEEIKRGDAILREVHQDSPSLSALDEMRLDSMKSFSPECIVLNQDGKMGMLLYDNGNDVFREMSKEDLINSIEKRIASLAESITSMEAQAAMIAQEVDIRQKMEDALKALGVPTDGKPLKQEEATKFPLGYILPRDGALLSNRKFFVEKLGKEVGYSKQDVSSFKEILSKLNQ